MVSMRFSPEPRQTMILAHRGGLSGHCRSGLEIGPSAHRAIGSSDSLGDFRVSSLARETRLPHHRRLRQNGSRPYGEGAKLWSAAAKLPLFHQPACWRQDRGTKEVPANKLAGRKAAASRPHSKASRTSCAESGKGEIDQCKSPWHGNFEECGRPSKGLRWDSPSAWPRHGAGALDRVAPFT
jgi:hypothetical protein